MCLRVTQVLRKKYFVLGDRFLLQMLFLMHLRHVRNWRYVYVL